MDAQVHGRSRETRLPCAIVMLLENWTTLLRSSSRPRFLLIALLAAVAAFAAPFGAHASNVSVAPSASTLSGDGGGTTTVRASAPVASPGTISQQLTQSFDPARLRLTGSNGIVAPAGWTLSYSSDGSTFGPAPGSGPGWAAIRAVRATGSLSSGGDVAGFQVATGTGQGTVPPSGAFTSAGGGDGWDVGFDEAGHVFNTFHHDGAWYLGFKTPGIDCHTRLGGSCGPGWPFSLRIADGAMGPDGIVGQPWYHTNTQSGQWVDTTNGRVWIVTTMADGTANAGSGFACVDVSDLSVGPAWCGGDIRNAFMKLAPIGACTSYNCTVGPMFAAGRLFGWDSASGRLMCMDPYGTHGAGLPGAACTGQPFSFTGISGASAASSSLGAVGSRVFGSSGTSAVCFDAELLQACNGWSSPGTLTASALTVAGVPDASGVVDSVCFIGFAGASPDYLAGRNCFGTDGVSNAAVTTAGTTGFIDYMDSQSASNTGPKNPETTGTRVYWADGKWSGGGNIYCWDAALGGGSGAACSGWPVANSAYTATVDAQNPNCIWTNTDSGAITTIDAVTRGSTCVTPPSSATLSAPLLLPRLACNGADGVRQWRQFELTGPAENTYGAARLTVLTASGQVLPGWNRVSIPSGARTVDLTGLSVQATGQSPRFRVELTAKTTNDPIAGTLTAAGESPQLCLPLVAQPQCPIAPAQVPGALPTPIAATVAGAGQASSGGATQVFGPGSASVGFSAPADSSCLGTISGTATMQNGGAAVAGTTVRLLDGSGAVVATASTDGTGAYSFSRLVAGTGYRVEFGPAGTSAPTTATDSSASTSRSVVAATTTTVNGLYDLLRTNRLQATTPSGTPVTLTASPVTSTGVQDSSAFSSPDTCIFDPADGVCRGTVTVAGQGTWTSGAGIGVTFTPVQGFAGQATPVRYRVTETSTSLTTWNWAEVTVDAPVPVTPPSVAPPGQQATSSPARPARLVASRPSASTRGLSTRVMAPGPGRITQNGTSVGPGLPTPIVACARGAIRVASAGPVTVNCRLTPAVRALLRTRAVRVTLVTTFVGRDGASAVSRRVVTLPRRASLVPVTG